MSLDEVMVRQTHVLDVLTDKYHLTQLDLEQVILKWGKVMRLAVEQGQKPTFIAKMLNSLLKKERQGELQFS